MGEGEGERNQKRELKRVERIKDMENKGKRE